ncbi:MAG: glycosyltransferase family 9 protein [Rhizomicrobium sp.]|jgi:ADP-heptose:LPS heptosyltransferase
METVLIFRIGSLGDTVVAVPCFHLIESSFPNARRILITDTPASHKVAPVESVLAESGLIDDVIYFPPPPRKLSDFVTLRSRIRAAKARTLIYVADRRLGGTLRDVAFFRACGVRKIIGAPIARDLSKLRIDPATGDTEREAERLARCLAPLGRIDLDNPAVWDLRLQQCEERCADVALQPLDGREFVAVGAGAKVEAKDWGYDNWARLLHLTAARQPDFALAFIGSSDESDRAAKLAARWPLATVNLCGRLTPRESAAVMRRARFFVGHDGGPLHLAAAMGVPCVGVFGDYNMPKWWHPMGRGHRIVHDMRGVRAITPETVDAMVIAVEADTQGTSCPDAGASHT